MAEPTGAAASAGMPPGELMEVAVGQLKTVPVPVLVGPQLASGDAASVDTAIAVIDGVGRAAAAADNGGGWFFSYPMWLLENGLVMLHYDCGLPWWGTIALTTLVARCGMLPLTVMQSKSMAKLAKVKPQLDVLQARLKEASSARGPNAHVESTKAQNELEALYKHHNIKPWYTIAGGLAQV